MVEQCLFKPQDRLVAVKRLYPDFVHLPLSGAFAVVEQCLFKPQDRLVAVKRLRPDFVKSKQEIESLKSEIALLRKLYDPHIIEYIGWGSWDDSSEEAAEKSLFLVQVWGGTWQFTHTPPHFTLGAVGHGVRALVQVGELRGWSLREDGSNLL